MTPSLTLHPENRNFTRSLTSVPWPADAQGLPSCSARHQLVPLFPNARSPKQKRYLLLTMEEGSLPERLSLEENHRTAPNPGATFSEVSLRTIRENVTAGFNQYNYREVQAEVTVAGRTIGIRLGLLPSNHSGEHEDQYSWWQWGAAQRLWSGPLAEAWRIGGHIPPYAVVDGEKSLNKGRSENWSHEHDASAIHSLSGNVLHADIYLIVWRDGALNLTVHYKAGYLHNWPKPIHAFPVLWLDGAACFPLPSELHRGNFLEFQSGRDVLDLSEYQAMFTAEHPMKVRQVGSALVLQPWSDLRVLAYKTEENELAYLDPDRPDAMPEGVSRTFRIDLGLDGKRPATARYHIEPAWYARCGVVETDHTGPAGFLASRAFSLLLSNIKQGGFDTGFLWRYLRRDLRRGVPKPDGADWDGDLSYGLYNHLYHTGKEPLFAWQLALQSAYHAADISIYHGSWMPRLEASKTFTAPIPKFRARGLLYGYLETGDPYLLDTTRAIAAGFMSMESFQQPRSAIGRDAFPVTTLMMLWQHTGESLYRDYSRELCIRLLQSQNADGGFSSQAGAGVFSGRAALPEQNAISFGSGILAPIALLTWAIDDEAGWPEDFLPRLRHWADLMLKLELPEGGWAAKPGGPFYALIGAGALFTMIKAGSILSDPECIHAVHRFVQECNRTDAGPSGTHTFLACAYAHVADRAFLDEASLVTDREYMPH